MSEVTSTPNGDNEPAEMSSEETPVVMTAEQLRQTNARLLEESKRYKQRFQELKKQLDAKDQAEAERQKKEAEEQGKFKSLYEDTLKRYDEMKKGVMMTSVKSAVSSVAGKLGCVNPDLLIKLGGTDMLAYDEATGEVHGAEMFVEECRKQHPYLFNTQVKPVINSAIPGAGRPTAEKPIGAKDIGKLKTGEFARLLMEKRNSQ